MSFSIIGKGASGVWVFRFLQHRREKCIVLDDQDSTLNVTSVCVSKNIVLSPGVSIYHPAIEKAISLKINIWSEIDIAAKSIPNCFNIGITGSNGKSTTTSVIGFLLGKMKKHIFVGGNLGIPLSQKVEWGENILFSVIELSSFQLETTKWIKFDIANLTNLVPNHLNRHRDVYIYYRVKQNIFKLLKNAGIGFDFSCPVLKVTCNYKSSGLSLIGWHNLQNLYVSILNLQAFGMRKKCIKEKIKKFIGIVHRLEVIGVKKGVLWINDAKSTSVFSSIVAITCFIQTIHCIMGGASKGEDYGLLERLVVNANVFFYIVGNNSKILIKFLEKKMFNIYKVENLDFAIRYICKNSRIGDVVLFSPGYASFDQFISYEHRGYCFKRFYNVF